MKPLLRAAVFFVLAAGPAKDVTENNNCFFKVYILYLIRAERQSGIVLTHKGVVPESYRETGVWNMNQQEKVLFVVYRTEWWGCFDRLCRQECHEGNLVYVMPIPRYDRELGTTKIDYNKMRFHPERLEGELPEGAVVADYRTFALEQGFDRIYIHNPYDNTYFVDSVDEKYYSCNLKQYTKRLVYISYLIFIDGIPEEYAGSPVYEYADAIYLADKKAKYFLEVQYDKKVEIVPSGIPEYLEKLEEQVKRKNQTAQGKNTNSSAKRLLCCLSYHNLFYGSEKLIQKLRDVFAYLKGRKDILLVFRPDEDIRARFPWLDEPLQKKYVELVAYFQRYKIGIYDESPDLYRAVAEADGMLSFGHPADKLFLVQGKYVLGLDTVQRPIPSDEVRCIPSLRAIMKVEEDDKIILWFVPERMKILCKAEIPKDTIGKPQSKCQNSNMPKKEVENLTVEIVAEIPDDILGVSNYINITKVGNYLYLSPYFSEIIWKYDMNTGEFRGNYLPNASGACVASTFSYGKYLYMIPKMYLGIIKYDTETEEIEILDKWIDELEKNVLPENKLEPFFCWAIQQEKNMLYMASSKNDIWMEYDMSSDSWKLKRMNLPGKKFVDLVMDGDRVWLLPYCGSEIILWNRITGQNEVIYDTLTKELKSTPFTYGLDMGNYIAVFPQNQTDYVLMIPKLMKNQRDSISQKRDLPCGENAYLSEYQKNRQIGYEFLKKLEDGRLLAYEYYDGAFLLLDERLQVKRKYLCRLPLDIVKQQEYIMWKNEERQTGFDGILHEGYLFGAMIDFFVMCNREYRDEIQIHYRVKSQDSA